MLDEASLENREAGDDESNRNRGGIGALSVMGLKGVQKIEQEHPKWSWREPVLPG